MLLKINERGRWTDPSRLDDNQRALQDEEIFQVARLVKCVYRSFCRFNAHLIPIFSCGHFMATIFGDYVAGFLGLGRDGVTWSMNPFDVCSSQPLCLSHVLNLNVRLSNRKPVSLLGVEKVTTVLLSSISSIVYASAFFWFYVVLISRSSGTRLQPRRISSGLRISSVKHSRLRTMISALWD